MDNPSLSAAFVGTGKSADDELEPRLGELVTAGANAWPELRIEPSSFAAHLARYVNDTEAWRDALGRLHVEDLYLACAILDGQSQAPACFERHCRDDIRRALQRMKLPGDRVDDLYQHVLEKVLMPTSDGRPGIAQYAGRGSLRAWLTIVATRVALNDLRGKRREVALDEAMLAAIATDGALATEIAVPRYKEELKAAFADAITDLSVREKNLVRQHFVDGLSFEALGKLYGVHRTTISRWMDSAQASLLTGVRKRIAMKLDLEDQQIDSIVRLVRSHFELTIEKLL